MVFVEYVMLAGVNDSTSSRAEMAKLLDPRAFKVNLIPYNPTGSFDGSAPGRSGPSAMSCSEAACGRRFA